MEFTDFTDTAVKEIGILIGDGHHVTLFYFFSVFFHFICRTIFQYIFIGKLIKPMEPASAST
jgi:hypothetical protein